MPLVPIAAGVRPPRGLLLPVLGAIVVLAWAALWWLEQSPWGWLFHQHGGTGHHAHHAVAVPAWLFASAFLAGWALMTIAMMLPTTVPLATLFQRMVARRPRAHWLITLLVTGYLVAWLGFGLVALALVSGINRLAAGAGWFQPWAWIWGAGLFLLAGAFQFSRLKYACLDRCRSPLGFINAHWHGESPSREAFNVGFRHGVFCVGCCWALMLLMFAVSTASLGWMLVLAVVMAVEKNLPWGRRAGRPVGVALLAAGLAIGVQHLLA